MVEAENVLDYPRIHSLLFRKENNLKNTTFPVTGVIGKFILNFASLIYITLLLIPSYLWIKNL